MNLLPFFDSSQARTALDDAREGEIIRRKPRLLKQELAEEENGIMGSVVLNVAFDDGVPGMGGGFLDAVEDGPGVFERADLGIGIGIEREEGGGHGGHLVGLDGGCMELFYLFLGPAGSEKKRDLLLQLLEMGFSLG
ncbi:hypothetical protein AAC387_Pa03g1861 [Persea americana]